MHVEYTCTRYIFAYSSGNYVCYQLAIVLPFAQHKNEPFFFTILCGGPPLGVLLLTSNLSVLVQTYTD